MCVYIIRHNAAGETGECYDEGASLAGSCRDGEEVSSFTCADDAFVAVLFFDSNCSAVRRIRVVCSTGEESGWIGSGSSSAHSSGSEECPGGWTEVRTSPEDSFGWPAGACVLEDRGCSDCAYSGPLG